MRKFNYELHPKNEKYPVLKFDRVGKGTLTIPKVYHDTYTEIITSDWYENSERTIKIDKETEMRIELYIRRQTIKLRLEFVGKPDKTVITQPKQTPIKITIDDVPHEIDGTDLEVELPYKATPYKVTVNKQFYEPLEFEFSLPSKESIVKEELKRKASEWVEKSRTETISFEKKTEEDDQLLPSKSYVKVKGVNGSRRWDWYEEQIDAVMTGAKTKETATVTKEPVTELYIQGTLKVEWKKEVIKTETIPFEKKTIEDKDTLPEDSSITTKGQDGERTYYREYEYANGKKTGGWRNETSEITTKVINEIYTQGTMVLEWRNMTRDEPIEITTRYEEDPDIPWGETRTVEGTEGIKTYEWEEEFKNGESTGRKRNETEYIKQEMVQTVIYRAPDLRIVYEVYADVSVYSGSASITIATGYNRIPDATLREIKNSKFVEIAGKRVTVDSIYLSGYDYDRFGSEIYKLTVYSQGIGKVIESNKRSKIAFLS